MVENINNQGTKDASTDTEWAAGIKDGHGLMAVDPDTGLFVKIAPSIFKGILDADISGKADKSTTVNNKPLQDDITLDKSDIGLSEVPNVDATITNAVNELYKQSVDPDGVVRVSKVGSLGFPLTNIITDGGFEEALSGWVNLEPNATTYFLDPVNKVYGSFGLKIIKTNTNNNGLEKVYSITPGKKYYLFAYAKSLAGLANYGIIAYKTGTDASNLANIYIPIANTVGKTTSFVRIGGKFTADPVNNKISVRLCARTANDSVIYDGLSLYEVDDATYNAIGTDLTGAALEAAIQYTNEDKIKEKIKAELVSYNAVSLIGFVDSKRIGDIGRGFDDTLIFQQAINTAISQGARTVSTPDGLYHVRDLVIPDYFQFRGYGSKTIFRLFRSGDNAADAAAKVLISSGSHSVIEHITIDNGEWYGNALDVIPDAGGFQRRISNVIIKSFAGYKANPIGGTFGIRKNFAKADISNDTGTHLLTGGNGITVKYNDNAGWELSMDNIRISNMDGYGLNGGKCTDSKFTNMWIGGCVHYGFSLPMSNKNCQMSNLKVYRCNILNPAVDFYTSLIKNIPHEASRSTDFGAVILTGANHQVTNFEIQENGSSGLQLGTTEYSCNNCILEVTADGNGGYDKDASNTVKEAYRRYGIKLVNYAHIKLTGVCDDFRAKFLLPRQAKGIYVAPRPEFTSTDAFRENDWYRIKTVAPGSRFDLYQRGYANQINAVGHSFQLRGTYPATPYPVGASFGDGGKLEAVNDFLTADLVILNQYDKDQNIGLDYDLSNDGGNSQVSINGVIVINKNEVIDLTSSAHTKASLNAKYPNAIKHFKVLANVIGYTYTKLDDNASGNWNVTAAPQLA